MKLTHEERQLSFEELDEIPGEALAVVDWRAELQEIVDEFARFLPPGYIVLDEASDGRSLTLRAKHATAVVPLTGEPPFGLDVGAAIASILPPELEARALATSEGSDTHSYLVRPRAWWDQLRAAHPKEYRSVFASPSSLEGNFTVVGGVGPTQPWLLIACAVLALIGIVAVLVAR